jgi:hypothetical protein
MYEKFAYFEMMMSTLNKFSHRLDGQFMDLEQKKKINYHTLTYTFLEAFIKMLCFVFGVRLVASCARVILLHFSFCFPSSSRRLS